VNSSDVIDTVPRRRRRRRDHQRLSHMLRALIAGHREPRMNVWQLRDALAGRAYGVLLFIFALPNIVPLPPGVNTVLSILIVIIAGQFVVGQSHPYFPSWLGRRSFQRADFEKAFDRIRPQLRWTERLLQPRLLFLTSRLGERLIGLLCMVLGLVAALPIPFGHELPGLAICLMALALLERDGLVLLAGMAIGLAGIALYWAVIVRVSAPLIGHIAQQIAS
jgi:hypothetical protein